MLLIKQHRIYRKDIQANPRILYIFGDNLDRVGMGGQAAEMRGESNSFGFATKMSLGHGEDDLMYDTNPLHKAVIQSELFNLKKVLDSDDYDAVVWPLDGIGTGLAMMQVTAPELLQYLTEEIHSLVKQA